MLTRGRVFCACAAVAMLAAGPLHAQGLGDWNPSAPEFELGGWTAKLGGKANLTGYTAHQQGNIDREGATAALFFDPSVEKLFDNGWRVGIRGTINAYHDDLSGDNYSNDVFQKAYLFLQTPYGRIELGQQDGAAYKMAVTGPLVASDIAIDDANIDFFRDPSTGRDFTNVFQVRTGVFATQNDAKISYYSPRLLGVQLGVSFTPHMAKDVFPYVTPGPHVPDRQENIVEGALNYTGYFGPLSIGAYAGIAAGHNAQRTAGHDDLLDWAVGGEADYDLGVATLAVGGAYRRSNGYTFDVGKAFTNGTTHAVHATTKLTAGPWLFGFEYSNGIADAEGAMSHLDATGYEASIGYAINTALQLTGGWQHQRFVRDTGVFYNGQPAVNLNAGFLYLQFHI